MTNEAIKQKEVISIPSLRVIKIEVSEDQNGNPQQTEVKKPEIKKADRRYDPLYVYENKNVS